MPFDCPICLEENLKDSLKVTLSCHPEHHFCSECLNGLLDLRCPFCRVLIKMRSKRDSKAEISVCEKALFYLCLGLRLPSGSCFVLCSCRIKKLNSRFIEESSKKTKQIKLFLSKNSFQRKKCHNPAPCLLNLVTHFAFTPCRR